MHLLKDENGNPIPHGGHDHEHCKDHAHCHDGEHHCEACEHDHKKECTALLSYMLNHNEHHAQELEQLSANLEQLGMEAAAKQIREAVTDFQKGNMRLSLALTLAKEEKEA